MVANENQRRKGVKQNDIKDETIKQEIIKNAYHAAAVKIC